MEAMVLINTAAEEFPRSLFFCGIHKYGNWFRRFRSEEKAEDKRKRKKGGSGRKERAEERRKRKKRGSGRKEGADEREVKI